ncbi:ABC transporter ATP-binding protein [[Clostridium] scindens]|uniref:ABC transporter ATP-binding protein n=1 Tax=Clostridium scindens (strain JCM 10418 / VPI 12708) TaxID=29347 RepID=UPI00399F9850
MANEALKMLHIMKVYPNGVMANRDVTLTINQGEIHALSGENGAGKSTLMKILFGEEQPTSGDIYIHGEKVAVSSPKLAIKMGIGMVHQHFMLVPSLTVVENIILGMEPKKGILIDKAYASKQVEELGKKYNLYVEPNKKIRDLTVGQKQKVEILKALFRGSKILILDEPTAVLTPQETQELFCELVKLRENGYTMIFISHKLHEIKQICDKVTIIRRGVTMGSYDLDKVTEQEISRLMVGRDVVLDIKKKPCNPKETLVKIRNLTIQNSHGKKLVDDVSFSLRSGEILGIAGVEGNGQSELIQALTGMGSYTEGEIEVNGRIIKGKSVKHIRNMKLSHIPEDRMTMGAAPHLSIVENMIADKLGSGRFFKRGILKKKELIQYGKEKVKEYLIFCKSPDEAIGSLSGGNIQKAVLARELSSAPLVIVANQPSRGVDVGATEFIRRRLIDMRDSGSGVLLVSSDLNEVLGLSDSLIVMFEGKVAAYIPNASELSEEELGSYMLGAKKQSQAEIQEARHE